MSVRVEENPSREEESRPRKMSVRAEEKPQPQDLPRKKQRAHSSSSEESNPRRHKHKHSKPKSCGKCNKIDLLDPSFADLSSRQKKIVKEKILSKIRNMQRNYPAEDIHLPSDDRIDDPKVCYRRYKRIAKHLYASQRISHYRFIMFFVTVSIQIGLSIFFETAASEYLQKELDDVSKYDSIFYEMGCKAFTTSSEPAPPQNRLIWQMITPVLLIAAMFMITKYTPVNKSVINLCMNLWTKWNQTGDSPGLMDGPGKRNYHTLLDDEDQDEDEFSDDDEEKKIPDLEANIPETSHIPSFVKELVPDVVKLLTSARALPEGSKPVTPGEIASNLMTSVMFGKPKDKPVVYDD